MPNGLPRSSAGLAIALGAIVFVLVGLWALDSAYRQGTEPQGSAENRCAAHPGDSPEWYRCVYYEARRSELDLALPAVALTATAGAILTWGIARSRRWRSLGRISASIAVLGAAATIALTMRPSVPPQRAIIVARGTTIFTADQVRLGDLIRCDDRSVTAPASGGHGVPGLMASWDGDVLSVECRSSLGSRVPRTVPGARSVAEGELLPGRS